MPIFHFQDFLNEDAKDDKRVHDIITKANGDSAKEAQLATTMANSIDKVDKAYERGVAASNLANWPIANIFFDRAVALGHPVDALIKQAKGHTGAAVELKVSTPGEIDKKEIDKDLSDLIGATWNIHYGQNGWSGMVNGIQYKKKLASMQEKYTTAPEIEYIIDELIRKYKFNGSYISKAKPGGRYGGGSPERATINDYVISLLNKLQSMDRAYLEKYDHLTYDIIDNNKKQKFSQAFIDECLLLAQSYKFDNDFVEKTKTKFSKPGKTTLYVTDPLACYVWGQIEGQLSDGYWENSKPYDHWTWIKELEVVLGTENKLVGARPWKSYNFNAVNSYIFSDGEKSEREFALKAYQIGSFKMFNLITSDWRFDSALRSFTDLTKVTASDIKSLTETCAERSVDLTMVKAFIGKTYRMKADQSLVSAAIKDISKSVYSGGKW